MCLCSSVILCIILFVLLYKLLDRLVRFPMRSSPSSRVNNILVTGCDSGFGRIFALRMASKGFRVYASCLNSRSRDDLEKSSPLIKSFLMDVVDATSIEEAYTEVKRSLSKNEGLWAVVNNAGIASAKMGPAEWLSRKDYLATCSVNLFGLIEVTRVFLPLLKTTRGRIVNTSSIAGRIGFPINSPYVVSKYGVEGFSDCLRYEMVTWGISVHVVEPGIYATNIANSSIIKENTLNTWQGIPDSLKEEYGEMFVEKLTAKYDYFVSRMASIKLDDVVDCYEHAILSYCPRGRYMPGRSARLVFWPLSLVPEWLSELIVSAGYRNIKPKRTY